MNQKFVEKREYERLKLMELMMMNFSHYLFDSKDLVLFVINVKQFLNFLVNKPNEEQYSLPIITSKNYEITIILNWSRNKSFTLSAILQSAPFSIRRIAIDSRPFSQAIIRGVFPN